MILENCNTTSFLQQNKGKTNLPSLSKNVNRLLKTITDADVNYQQLAEIIKQSPEISTRLIFLANSAWVAPTRPVSSIVQACSILGHSIVKSISFGISISSSFDTRKCPGFKADHFWTTSMLVSEGAGLLASRLSIEIDCFDFEQTAQSAGLLHNIGLLWLADNLPNETNKALQEIATEPSLSVSETLLQYTGTGYCEVGGWLGDQLGFPEVLIVAIKHHLDNDYQESFWEAALLVGSAAIMVTALHEGSDELPKNARLEALGLSYAAQEIVFKQLSRNYAKTHELARTMLA